MKLIPSIHLMSEYSFLESTIKIDSLIAFAKEKGLKELVITDRNNMFGAAEFINKCKKNNIKPVVGVDFDVLDYRLIVIAKNEKGFKLLLKLSSEKKFGKEILPEMINDNDVFIIDHPTEGIEKKHGKILPYENFYSANNESAPKSVCVNVTRSLLKEDNDALILLDSLRAGSLQQEQDLDSFYKIMKVGDSTTADQSYELIKSTSLEKIKDERIIPKYQNPDNVSSKDYLLKVVKENLKTILKDKADDKEYLDRIKYELSIINKLNFEDYFLIIWDIVKWSRKQGIIIGPGRGSAAGSLVSFVLNITEIDSIKYELLFERFLNPERVTMPDVDIDIQDNRRDEVVKYLFDKYSLDNTALISTFQKLAAKGSLRDVGRLLGMPSSEVLAITKVIPNFTTLQEAYDTVTRFRAVIDKSEQNTRLFKLSTKIEGLPRQTGTHPAGVVISDNPLVQRVPIMPSTEGLTQVQYSMDYLEENGLLKIDLLGLRNLTILQDIQTEIIHNHNKQVSLIKIPICDNKTNELLSSGDVNGIFQLESYGMKRTVKQVGVSSINDLAAIISLYRPGPMEFIKLYAEVKNGQKKVEKIDPILDKILKPTYGIIIYQEQIMKIAQEYAGMTFGSADILRRAIGKKKASLIDSLKNNFIKGSIENGHSESQANKVYELIERFANYGFNKSHAYAYAMLGYWMAYLKSWFPFEFYTALIKASESSVGSLKTYILEAKTKGIEIIGPDINISKRRVYNKKPQIILPLSIIKGLGDIANSKIMEEREAGGKFKDFYDFVARTKKAGLGDSIIESLIKSYSLRSFGNSQSLLDSLPQALRFAKMIISEKDGVKEIDFSILSKPKLINSEENIKLSIKNELDLLGVNVTIFKTTPYEKTTRLISIKEGETKEIVLQLGYLKTIKDKNDKTMAIASVEDSSTGVELFIFGRLYEFIKNTKKGSVLKAKIEKRNGSYSLKDSWEVIDG